MTPTATAWTVLVTVRQDPSQDPITEGQTERILDVLGDEDAWVQYPPASGRGHGFETRWWQRGEDAPGVAIEAVARFRRAVAMVGIDVEIVLVHVASPEDRLSETVIGLDGQPDLDPEAGSWNATLRAIPRTAPKGLDAMPGGSARPDLKRLLELLPDAGSSGFARDGLVEVRFWIEGSDAVDAADRAAIRFSAAMTVLGHPDWTIVRSHITSIAEARRTAYLGVERWMRARTTSTSTVLVRP